MAKRYYGRLSFGWRTPYAMSKRLAEEYLHKWCYEHNVILGIIRPSLIAGPNPPGNLGGYDLRYTQWEILQYCWKSGAKECIDGTGYSKSSSSVGRKREASTMYVTVITRLSESLRLLFAGNWIKNCLYQYLTG